MTLFDWCVVGFIPVAIVLILIEFVANDWDINEMMYNDEGGCYGEGKE